MHSHEMVMQLSVGHSDIPTQGGAHANDMHSHHADTDSIVHYKDTSPLIYICLSETDCIPLLIV